MPRCSAGNSGCRALPVQHRNALDVLSFPPDAATLDRWRASELAANESVERRGRVALFLSIGLFFAWVADVGATFSHVDASAAFGVASVVLAIVIVASHLGGRWALERARRTTRAIQQRHAPVQMGEAGPLLELARRDPVARQYLRLVGRQRRPLRLLERDALQRWATARQNEPAG